MPYKSKDHKKANTRRRQRARRSALVDLMGGYCHLCLYQGPYYSFDFHHTRDKSFSLSQPQFSKPWSTLLQEADKCVLLCKCCHAQLHYGS